MAATSPPRCGPSSTWTRPCGDGACPGPSAPWCSTPGTTQRELAVAIALVHPIRKSAASQPGQALRGSGDLHAWGDSNLYLLRRKGELQLHVEHRAHPAQPAIRLRLEAGPARLEAGASVEEPVSTDLESEVLRHLAERSPMTRTALRDALRVRNERLGEALRVLEERGAVVRSEAGWAVPRSRP